jgi:hypothetical protein
MLVDFAVVEERVAIEQAARMVALPITSHGGAAVRDAERCRIEAQKRTAQEPKFLSSFNLVGEEGLEPSKS